VAAATENSYASRVDDPQRKPAGRDRDVLVARIHRAAEQGRIGTADRDIRLGNVAGAQSMAELDLISRELDQLEASLPAQSATAPAWTGPGSPELADELTDKAVTAARVTARSIGVSVAVIVALALVGVGAAALIGLRSSSHDSSTGTLVDPVPITPSDDVTADPADDPSPTTSAAGTPYSLTGRGIRAFLALYREKFATSEVIDLTMYGDYVVVDVPVRGKARHAGWLYRSGQGFTTFGGVTANFPGARPVDTQRLSVPALVRNLARARSTLGVEDPTTVYAIVRHYASVDEAPNVYIHVANDFQESGYLATTLDGTVERAYPSGG
jgi:hypothetical protein